MYGGNHYNHSHHPHHHYPSHYHKGGPTAGLPPVSPESAHATEIFDHFIVATTFKSVLHHYKLLCDVLRLRPTNIRNFYPKLKSKIRSWKAQAIWTKFDKRIAHKCYNHGKACNDTKVLIIGCGPCGLRSAIEAQLLGAKVVVVEKRDRFSRNNVLHLWPFVITDLKALGAKKFYGKFCAGAIDHISIRQLQCILLKVALLLGVEIFEGVTFEELLEPPEDQSQRIGWHARFSPAENPVNQYEFDVLIGADGKRNTLMGFKRKEFRGKLAIAITANFINKHSEQEARVQEISGVAFIFNQKFFKDLYADTGIDLENIVYYKDETHYFVMTAKKHSLIDKGVILRDLPDTQQLLHPNNVDRQALCDYAREAADFSTGYLMPHLEFAVNHYGKPDIAMFDFTSMFAAENACRVIEKNGHKLLKCLVGDSLLEPFWPTGSGCARGFLSSFDACWATRSWAANKANPLEVIAERESIYRLLAQTTPENLSKDYSSYTLEPSSRYPTVNLKVLLPFQVRHLFNTDEPDTVDMQVDGQLDLLKSASVELPRKRKRRDSIIHPETLLSWCQKQVTQHPEIEIENLSSSFKDGRVLCAIIHRYRPDLIDFESLNPEEESLNNQLALDILEKEFGIVPILTGAELSSDMTSKPCLMSFISQIHDSFRGEIPQSMGSKPPLKSLKGQNMVHLDLEDFPTHGKNLLDTESSYTGSSVSSPSSASRISCKILEEPQVAVATQETLQQIKKRRNEVGSMDANAYQRRDEIQRNREERLRKQKKQRELNTVRFIRSMRMLHCDVRSTSLHSTTTPSFRQSEDADLAEYRKQCVKSMKEKAADLERKIYFPDKLDADSSDNYQRSGCSDPSDQFSDRVRGLEAKFKGESSQQKPKDMIRAIGRLERTDWNLSAIEKKIEENPKPQTNKGDKERVPKWSKDVYNDKFQNIERRLRENGEDEERIAKYLDIDASLQRLERKLREGSTLETGLRGHNKVSNLANQLSSKLVRQVEDKMIPVPRQVRAMILPSTTSDLCYFCDTRVYLVERLSAEGKFFHRQCFKCNYCGALLRLGNYIYDREHRFGGKFFCIPHFGLTVRSRVPKRPEETARAKDASPSSRPDSYFGRNIGEVPGRGEITPLAAKDGVSKGRHPNIMTPQLKKVVSPLATLADRGTTPERVEFENSVIEHSDEEEYLSEEEWTDRNFGASANELDDDDDDDSDYSDLSDEEIDEEVLESPHQLTADETRRLAESWKRRYSNDVLEGSDHESMSDSEIDELSEEHGADGDESHTATEGDVGEGEEEEELENDKEKRARELRRLEFNINIEAPPKAETSDSGSETEIASEEDSDTEIDTDSEFAEDHMPPHKHKEIPTIVIDELPLEANNGGDSADHIIEEDASTEKEFKNKINEKIQEIPKKAYIAQVIPISDGTERSTSLTKLPPSDEPNPRTEQLKRLLHRTESTEAVSAYKSSLRRQYLLGNNSSVPKKSVSSADLGDRFKSFMDKISETQKKLNPAPEPSPAMQAFLNSSSVSSLSSSPTRSPTIALPKLISPIVSFPSSIVESSSKHIVNGNSTLSPSHTEESSDTSKSEEGKIFCFPDITKPSDENTTNISIELSNTSDYKNVPFKSQLPSLDASLVDVNKNNKDTMLIEEPSFPVHLEEETDNIFCVDAKNICMIESLTPNTSKDNLGSIHDFLSAKESFRDSKLILNDELPALPANEDITELTTLQLIENKNNKNVSNDSIILEDIANCSEVDIDIDECFDQLAKDAMSEINQIESSIVPLVDEDLSFHARDTNNFSKLESLKGNSIDNNFNLKFTSMEETFENEKKDVGDLVSLEIKNTYRPKENIEELNIVPYSPKEHDSQEIQSPETVGLTECDLSDWAEDNEVISFGGDEMREELVPYTVSLKKKDILPNASLNVNRIRARIASLESLEDSDSAVSISAEKNETAPSPKPSALNDIEQSLDYMDTSGSESSIEDNTNIVPFSYKKLQDETPVTTPTIDVVEKIDLASYGVTTPKEDTSCKDDKPLSNFKSKSLESEEVIGDSILRSASESQVLIEKSSVVESSRKPITPKRYEGYIPRFKDRVTPFSLVRDSIDVRKCSSSTPLFTPSKEDILQREANERIPQNMSLSFESSGSSLNSPSVNVPLPPIASMTPVSPVTNSSFSITSSNSSPVTSSVNSSLSKGSNSISLTERNSVLSSKSIGRKPKDGDVVKDMVMSRVTKRSPDKVNRRASRNALHLSFNSSTSSLFGSEPSLNKGSNTPASADLSKSVKENEFSFTSDTSYKKGIDDTLNKCAVPSMSNRSMIDLSERTSAKPITNDKEIEIASPRKVLPATPLTHPEKFQRENLLKRDLFKSTPHLSSSTLSNQTSSLTPSPPLIPDTPSYSSNDGSSINKPSSIPNKFAQSKTIIRAQSESPLPKLKSSNVHVHLDESIRGKILSSPRDRPSSVPIEKTKKDPEERLKELLAERKKKESEEQRDVRLRNKDTCLQECLEEYRQKRNSAPIPQGFSQIKEAIITDLPKSQNKSNQGNNKRHFHRPSILELESMQVFSSPNKASVSLVEGKSLASPLGSLPLQEPNTNINIVPTTVTSTLSFRPQSPTLSTPPLTPSSNVTPTSAKSVEVPKKSVKKSKDRERRRSLIQVFAGMFTKSEDKKKPVEDEVDSSLNNSINHISRLSVSPPPVLPPKSPSVKERFTKLRLSRSKDKKKPKNTNKNRSASADIPGEGDDEGLPSSLSLPTSPSRTIFSFLSSPSTRSERAKHSASGPSSKQSGQLYHSSCIKEENGSEEEGSLHATAAPFSGKDTLPCNATPSTRRQKAVLRAAKQAEQKRLRMAQEIQRQLEECEVMTRELEEKGIKIEKALAGETDGTCREDAVLTKEWFRLVREKNELIRWQEELMIKAKELELEDRHVRLENELRQRMTCSERDKTRDDIDREGRILAEIISVIEEKDALVNQMEEERQRYAEEDKELEALEARKILQQTSFQQETGV